MSRASRELFFIAPELIQVPEDRQRKMNFEIDDLIPAIRARGIDNPLLLREVSPGQFELVAGERRLRTAIFLKLAEVPFRAIEGEVSDLEIQIIELEENFRRKNLTWQDNASAMWKIHKLYVKANGEDWSQERTAGAMNITSSYLSKLLDLGEAIEAGDQSVIKAETQANATTLLSRRRNREVDETLNRILSDTALAPKPAGGEPLPDGPVRDGDDPDPQAEVGGAPARTLQGAGAADAGAHSILRYDGPPVSPYSILHAEAGEYLAGYSGEKFNLLHADLPYGVALNGQAQQGAFEGGGYESTPEIYFALTDMLLKHWDSFMYPNAHVMWWFAFRFYEETIARFEKGLAHLDVRIQPTPLIWHKTDNRGILADPMRGPRNIGEYALLISTGDRKIVKPVANIYGAPTAKGESIHTNEKSEPMLKHFLSMLVDGHSRVLDPTAGSGSAIRVAESLGAEAALGLEFNAEFAARAQSKLETARSLKKLAAAQQSS